MSERLRYARRLELIEHDGNDALGYAVFSGCDGEVPSFVAFFTNEETAEALCAMAHPEEPEHKLVFDSAIVPAVLTPHGIVASNDFEVDDHAKLRALIAFTLKSRGRRP
jgi:hypothetical protein